MTIDQKKVKKNLRDFLIASVFAISFSSESLAQITPSVEPGIIARDLEGRKITPRSDSEIVITRETAESQGQLSEEKVFILKKVLLDGTTVYKQSDIDELAKDYAGKEVSFADLLTISQAITKKYREDGYMFSRAVLSPQKIADGTVRLTAIEGRVTDVTVAGTYKDDDGRIQAIAQKIKSEGPANEQDIERYLLLIDDLPGISARSLLKPSATPGGGELIITVEQDMFEGSLGIDNRGSRYFGPYRATAVAAVNSLFGIHDRTTLRGVVSSETDELRFGDIVHEEQLGNEGTKIKGRFAVTKTEPGDNLDVFDIKGDSRLFDLVVEHPFIRSRQQNLTLLTGFTALNSESDLLGVNVAKDRVRSVRGGGLFDFTDSWSGISQVELVLTKGVNVFNATSDGVGRSRATGEHNFLRANVSATRIQEIGSGFSVQLSTSGQYSGNSLLSSEEFSVGGPDFGRAYDAGEIAGDSGIAGAIEARYSDIGPNDIIETYQLYTYYDAGKVWNTNLVVSELPTDSLSSVGAGVRFNLKYGVTGYLEMDKPLSRTVTAEGNKDPRVFFSLLKRF